MIVTTKCGTVLLFLALLTLSTSAPTNEPQPPNDGKGQADSSKETATSANGSPPDNSTTNDGDDTTSPETDQPPSGLSNPGDSEKGNAESPTEKGEPPSKAKSTQVTKISKAQLVHDLWPIFNHMSVENLKLLLDIAESDKPEQFEGMVEALYEGENDIKVFNLVDQLKSNFDILPGMLKGAIIKNGGNLHGKEPKAKLEVEGPPASKQGPDSGTSDNNPPNNGNKQDAQQTPPNTNDDSQPSARGNQQVAVDTKAEMIAVKQLLKVLTGTPSNDLQRILYSIEGGAAGDEIKNTLLTLKKGAAPSLTDDLIDYAAMHLMKLKEIIQLLLEDNESQSSVTVASSVVKNLHSPTKTNSEHPSDTNPPAVPKTSEDEKVPSISEIHDSKEVDENWKDPIIPDDEWEFEERYNINIGKNNKQKKPLNVEDIAGKAEVGTNVKTNKDKEKHTEQKDSEKKEKFNLPAIGQNVPNGPPPASSSEGGWFGMWHFLIIFLVIVAIVGVGYVCAHNRKRLREGMGSYIADAASRGRRNRNYRYKPLHST